MMLERAQFLKSNDISNINHYTTLGKLIDCNESQFFQL